ncbi:exonuclease domain-containing protein [Streptomyces stelliscabiei]|uniref:exonuclease domain-containing protein n=1 Tax=Streptomyces stelliscabiei TaxID=146820 RepID=UPI002FF3ECD3
MWHRQRMAALDFECSDKIPETARIVSCALILLGGELPTDTRTWEVNPGIAQEPGAIAVHGLTDEYLAEHGTPAAEAVTDIAKAVAEVVASGTPLVGHNLGGFDLNLLNHECLRHSATPSKASAASPHPCDRHDGAGQACRPYRRRVSEKQGPYQMRTTAETYRLGWDEASAHGAEYDALMSARAAYKMGAIAHTRAEHRPDWVQGMRNRRGPYDRFDDLAGVAVEELHQRQIKWAADSAASYQEWLRDPVRSGDKHNRTR